MAGRRASDTPVPAPLVLRDGRAVPWSARVHSLKGVKPQRVPDDGIYIGRALSMGGWRLQGSPLANPFRVGDPAAADLYALDESLRLYWDHVLARAELRAALLRDLAPRSDGTAPRLYCWCHTLTKGGSPAKSAHHCHGDVLVAIYEQLQHNA